MLSTPEFKKFSEDFVLFLHNTSYCDDEPYPDLLKEKGGNGYPTVSIMSAQGRLIKQADFPATLEGLKSDHVQALEWQILSARVAAGDKAAETDLFVMEIERGMLTFEEANKRLASLDLPEGARKALNQSLINLEFSTILKAMPREEQQAEAGKLFLTMLNNKRIPNTQQITSFWQYLFIHAEKKGDPKLFGEILAECKRLNAEDPRMARYIRSLEARLANLKKKDGL